MSAEAGFFYAFAALALLGAVAMVGFVRNVVAGALSLVVTMVALAGIYVLLEAHFLAAVQLLVYAGAIVVLFLFVIMLLDVRIDAFEASPVPRSILRLAGGAGALALAFGFARLLQGAGLPSFAAASELPAGFGGFRDIGLQLFTSYAVPVELVGLLLLAAIVGAVILARPRVG